MGGEGRVRIGDRDGTNLALIARTIDQVGFSQRHPVRRAARSSVLLLGISVGATNQPNERRRRRQARHRARGDRDRRTSRSCCAAPGRAARSITAASVAAPVWGSTGETTSTDPLARRSRRPRARAECATCRRRTHRSGHAGRARRRGAGRRRRRSSRTCGRAARARVQDDRARAPGRRAAGSPSSRRPLVAPPGIEYYVTAGDALVFATPSGRTRSRSRVPEDDERRTRDAIARRTRVARASTPLASGSSTAREA